MYRKSPVADQSVFDFALPFGGRLNPSNRWIILSGLIPWTSIEEEYADNFSESNLGCPAKPCRVALGALIIKERLGTTDREVVQQIRENPYLQYFLGFSGYSDEEPFDASMMVHFRKRFSSEELKAINEDIIAVQRAVPGSQDHTPDDDSPVSGGASSLEESSTPDSDGATDGTLIIDASCTPADIPYPTDLKLLNEARLKSEEIIDVLHAPDIGRQSKPRTYRKKAARQFNNLIRQRQPSHAGLRQGIRQQLNYLRRNLKTIDRYAGQGRLVLLKKRLYILVLVINEVYRQQQWMYKQRCRRIADRIVNLYQPHVRPIVRGKAGTPVEFGAKISVSMKDGFSHVDRISWDPYNESGDLIAQAEAYKRRYGCYPSAIQCDKIYRTRENRKYCKKRNIRLSGPPLGRPPQQTPETKEQLRASRQQQIQDEKERQAIEGKFGQAKRRFTLNRIMARLAETSETVILVSFIVMNLEKILRDLLLSLFSCRLYSLRPISWVWKPLYRVLSGEFYWPYKSAGFHLPPDRYGCAA